MTNQNSPETDPVKQEDPTVKEESLKKKSGRVVTRCREINVKSIKTAVGLRNLRDTITDMENEIDLEITKERKIAQSGDELDEYASNSEIDVWKAKKAKLKKGRSHIASRTSQLMKEASRR